MPRKLTETLGISNEEIKSLILDLLCKDFTQVQIKEMLEISLECVHARIREIKEEYGVETMHGLVFKFLEEKNKTDK